MTLNLSQAGGVATIASVSAGAESKTRINGLGLRIGQEVATTRYAHVGGQIYSKPEYEPVDRGNNSLSSPPNLNRP